MFAARRATDVEARLSSAEIQQYTFRALLDPFEDNFAAIGRDVEVLNVEIRRKVGQIAARRPSPGRSEKDSYVKSPLKKTKGLSDLYVQSNVWQPEEKQAGTRTLALA